MEVVVQEMVKGDKHVAWDMKIRPLCTLRAPGCGCSAPHSGASIRGFPTLVYCNARLPSLVPGCLSLEGVSGVSVENPLGSSENKCHKNMPGLEQGKREWTHFVVNLMLTLFNKRRNGILQLGSPGTAKLGLSVFPSSSKPIWVRSSFFPWDLPHSVSFPLYLFIILPLQLGLDCFPLKSIWIQMPWTITWCVTLLR